MNMKRALCAFLVSGVMMTTVAGIAAAAPNDQASENGHCSVSLAADQDRDDASHVIGSLPGNPGSYFSDFAKNKGDEGCTGLPV